MRTKAVSMTATFLFVMMFLASAVLVAGPREEGPTAATPEERTALWRDTLERFLTRHPGLSAEQQAAVLQARDAAGEEMFLANPGAEAREALTLTLTALDKGLKCARLYDQVLSDFRALGAWLEEHDIGSTLNNAYCNCGDGGCAPKFDCKSVGCTVERGTTNWGICESVDNNGQ